MMRFDLTIPAVTAMRAGKEAYVEIAEGTELHRIHPAVFKADEFNPTSFGNARFSPIHDATGNIIPTIYAAQSFACAACEIILRCPDTSPIDPATGIPTLQIVSPSDFSAYAHSTIRTRQSLKLIDLTTAGQRRIGVNHNALLAGPRSTYPATRAWAEALHAACPLAQGIYYSSVQYGPEFAILLFGDRTEGNIFDPTGTRTVADPDCQSDIVVVARQLSIEYQDF